MALSGWRLQTQNIHLRQCWYYALEAPASLHRHKRMICFSFNFICNAEGRAKIDDMFLFDKTRRIDRIPGVNHFLCLPKIAPTRPTLSNHSLHCTLALSPFQSTLFAHYRHFVSLRSLSLPDCFAWTCCRCPRTRTQPGWEQVEKNSVKHF